MVGILLKRNGQCSNVLLFFIRLPVLPPELGEASPVDKISVRWHRVGVCSAQKYHDMVRAWSPALSAENPPTISTRQIFYHATWVDPGDSMGDAKSPRREEKWTGGAARDQRGSLMTRMLLCLLSSMGKYWWRYEFNSIFPLCFGVCG